MAADATMSGVNFGSQIPVDYKPTASIVPVNIGRPQAPSQPVQEVSPVEQTREVDLSTIKEDLFSSDLGMRNKAIEELSRYFKKFSDNKTSVPEEIFNFLINILNELSDRSQNSIARESIDQTALSGLVIEFSENIDAIDFFSLKDSDTVSRLREALTRFKTSLGTDNAYINKFIDTVEKKLPITAVNEKTRADASLGNEKLDGLIEILSSETSDSEKLTSVRWLYEQLVIELKKKPLEAPTVQRIVTCFLNLSLKLDFNDDNLYSNGTLENTVFSMIFNLKKYFNNKNAALLVGINGDFLTPVEQKLITQLNAFSQDPAGKGSEKLILAIALHSNERLVIWSEDFQKAYMQRVFLSVDNNEGFRTFERVLVLFVNNPSNQPLEIMLHWLQNASTEVLSDIVFRILKVTDKRVNKSENIYLDNLVRGLVSINRGVEVVVNDRLYKEDLEKSQLVEADISAIYLGFDKFINKKEAINQVVDSKAEGSKLNRWANKVPISGLKNLFNNKWREKETELAKTSIEAQIKIEIDNSINLLGEYFLGETKGKSLDDFLRYALLPNNIVSIREIFVSLKNIYDRNNPDGFKSKILRIFSRALFNPVLLEIMPNEVKAFPFDIWKGNLNIASIDYSLEYEKRKSEYLKLKNGQTIANTSKKFLDEAVRKKSELTQVYDKISDQRSLSVLELRRVLSSSVLLDSYCTTPGFGLVLEKLYETTIEREPLNAEDMDVIKMLYGTQAWNLLSVSSKTKGTEKILLNYVAGKKQYLDLIREIVTSKEFNDVGSFVVSVYLKMLQTNPAFRERTNQLEQRDLFKDSNFLKNFREFDELVVFADMRSLNETPVNFPEVTPESPEQKQQRIQAEVFEYFDLIDKKTNPRELIRILKDFYIYITQGNVDTASLTAMFESLPQRKSVVIGAVLDKLVVLIYINKRNVVLSSLCEAIFNKIIESAPPAMIRNTNQITPFDFIQNIQQTFPKRNLEIGEVLKAKVENMKVNYNRKLTAAAA